MQLPLFTPDSKWRAPSELPSFRHAKRIAIDVETRDEQLTTLGTGVRHGGYIVGISIAIDDCDRAFYLPIRHEDSSDNLCRTTIIDDYLYNECKHFRGEVVGANLLYDLDYLSHELIDFPNAKAFLDIQVAEALIDENQFSYSLDNVAKRRLGEGKDEGLLNEAALTYHINAKKDLWRLPARYVGAYAEADVRLPLAILKKQEEEIAKQGLERIWKLESDVTPVIHKMVRYGVRVDEERLEACKVYFQAQEEQAYKDIQAMTGRDLRGDINTPACLASLLSSRGVVLPKTVKSGKDSVTKDVLAALDDPLAKLLVRARRFNKATGTFYESVKKRLAHGRLHPTFCQLRSDEGGTVTGRLSSRDPNIQQQPVRDPEIGKMWRSIYIPDHGCQWLRGDYKAQEPRLFLHYAAKLKAAGAGEMVQRYRDNPDTDPYRMMCPDLPKDSTKAVYLGKCYGMGREKLSMDVARVVREAGDASNVEARVMSIIYHFSSGAPYFNETIDAIKDRAQKVGYVVSLLGRRCRIDGEEWIYKAPNKLMQSGAADQTKQAMVDLHALGTIPHFPVHDELNFSIGMDDNGSVIKRTMENAVRLEVPVVVDIKLGASWGDCK